LTTGQCFAVSGHEHHLYCGNGGRLCDALAKVTWFMPQLSSHSVHSCPNAMAMLWLC